MKWPNINEIDSETQYLMYLVYNGWDFHWPGWVWVSNRLNAEYGNNRSVEACRKKFDREYEKERANNRIEQTSCSSRRYTPGDYMIESRYMEFDKIGDTGKTEIWNIISKSSGFILGQIKWYGAWRQYCFWPSSQCVFNTGCMDDIQKMIKKLMDQRRITTQFNKQPKGC